MAHASPSPGKAKAWGRCVNPMRRSPSCSPQGRRHASVVRWRDRAHGSRKGARLHQGHRTGHVAALSPENRPSNASLSRCRGRGKSGRISLFDPAPGRAKPGDWNFRVTPVTKPPRGARGALAGAAIATAAAAVVLPGSGPAGVEPGGERSARTLPAPVVPAFRPGMPHGSARAGTSRTGRPSAARRSRAPRPIRPRRSSPPSPPRRPRARTTRSPCSPAAPTRAARAGSGSGSPCCPTARPAGSRARRSAATRPSTRASTSTSSTCARPPAPRPGDPARAGRRGHARGADAARALLRAQPAHPLPQSRLRPGRVRDERAVGDGSPTGPPAGCRHHGTTALT